jgi:transposase
MGTAPDFFYEGLLIPETICRVGLVPAEHSCGRTRCKGGITRTGNTHARRILIESA